MTKFIDVKEIPAPKDGTLLLLIVKSLDDDCHPTEDSEIFRTIGFNAGDDNGEDVWQCAGWNCCGYVFTDTTGEIIGWARLPEIPSNMTAKEEPGE